MAAGCGISVASWWRGVQLGGEGMSVSCRAMYEASISLMMRNQLMAFNQ
jgi:hypothetical protein